MKLQSNEIKIAFFDIDGTLKDFSKDELSDKTCEALNRLKEKGVLLAIATGRAPLTLPKMEGVEFDVFLMNLSSFSLFSLELFSSLF